MTGQASSAPNGSPEAMRSENEIRRRFVAANTQLGPVAGLPELVLRQADEAHELWHRTERELSTAGLPPPFWAFAWAGGLGLARHILDHPETVRGRRVLDFAAGSGLVAIAALRAGGEAVTACDIDPFATAAMHLNAAANGVALHAIDLDLVSTVPEADLVLAGDVFYDRGMAALLAPWFTRMTSAGIEVLVGDPDRPYFPHDRAEPVARLVVPTTLALEDVEVKPVTVWRWRAE